MNFCKNCGSRLQKRQLFCSKCNTAVVRPFSGKVKEERDPFEEALVKKAGFVSFTTTEQALAERNRQLQARRKRKMLKVFSIFFVILLLASGVVFWCCTIMGSPVNRVKAAKFDGSPETRTVEQLINSKKPKPFNGEVDVKYSLVNLYEYTPYSTSSWHTVFKKLDAASPNNYSVVKCTFFYKDGSGFCVELYFALTNNKESIRGLPILKMQISESVVVLGFLRDAQGDREWFCLEEEELLEHNDYGSFFIFLNKIEDCFNEYAELAS